YRRRQPAPQSRNPMTQKFLPARAARTCVVTLCLAGMAPLAASAATPLYKDAHAPLEQRVDDLLSRMTPDEKLAQITAIWTQKPEIFDTRGEVDPARLANRYPNGIGQFSRPNDLKGSGSPLPAPFRDERRTVALVNAIQKYQMTKTRLGIP